MGKGVLMAHDVKIYTKDPCPFCDRAINLLNQLDVKFEEIDLTGKQDEIDRIKNETGWRTVPIIMIDGKLVGGYTDLQAMVAEGKFP
jgi:glutaredoxin 3